MDDFGSHLRASRIASGLTQAGLAERSGVARPNIVAYESARREPLFRNALDLLNAAGAQVAVELPVVWTWTDGRRPYAVPSRLWRLPPAQALQQFQPGGHLWRSGPPRSFDLASRPARAPTRSCFGRAPQVTRVWSMACSSVRLGPTLSCPRHHGRLGIPWCWMQPIFREAALIRGRTQRRSTRGSPFLYGLARIPSCD